MGYYMSEYFQNFNHLIKIYIQCTIQNSQTSEQFCCCQGMTCFPLQKHLRVFPTLTSDTFSILQTPTTFEFQRCFRVLPFPSPFQQSPTLLCTPSTLNPCLTPPPKAAPRPPPPLKVTQWPLWTPHPLVRTPLWRPSETLRVIAEIGWLLQHPILRVASLK